MKTDKLNSKAHYLPKSFFPTPVWLIPLDNTASINKQLIVQLKELQSEDNNVSRSNQGGWHSNYNLHKLEQLKPIHDYFAGVVEACIPALGIDLSTYNVVIREMWLNVNEKGHYNSNHVHPNSDFSAVYYVCTATDCGDLILNDPINERTMRPLPESLSPFNTHSVSIPPKENTLVIFPSWLRHETGPNNSEHRRISLSFNIAVKARASAV